MKNFFTLTLCFFTLSITAQEAGCTYSIANNYSYTATVDDGTCVFGGVNVFDYDNDGNIAINDFIAMLSYFGDTDSDSDGVFDSVDECIDETACNYLSNPTVQCYYIDAIGVCGGHCSADDDDDGVCDAAIFLNCGDDIGHESYNYTTVQIGEQCWFSENCRYLPTVSPSSEGSESEPYYYVYGYESADVYYAMATDNFETYGVLYNWPAVMGACPSGWHIPTDGEFTQLTDFLGGESVAGGKMKDDAQWNGSNSSGFTGLPGGYRFSYGGFDYNGIDGYWWSASGSGSHSWARKLYNDYANVNRSYNGRSNGFSARCVRD